MTHTRINKWGALLLAVALVLVCFPPLRAFAAQPTEINQNGNVLGLAAGAAYPTAKSYFVAGDTYYQWALNTGGFNNSPSSSELNGNLTASFHDPNIVRRVFSNAAMAGLFDLEYTPYNATSKSVATVALKFKSNITTTTTLSGTFQLQWIGLSQAVTLSGKVFASKTGTTTAGNRITGIDTNISLARSVKINGQSLASGQSLDNLVLRPDSYITMDLDSLSFNWQNGKPAPVVNVTQTMLNNGKITVNASRRSGSSLVEKIAFETQNGKTYVRVDFVEELVATSDRDFNLTVSLYLNGARNTQTEVVLAGVLANQVVDVDSDTDYVDLSGGQIANTTGNISAIEVYAGHYITVHTRMFNDRKYYVKSNTNISAEDEKILSKYTDIVGVYNINHISLLESSSKASFDMRNSYYVYDKDLNYLGTTREKLAFRTKYYLADKRLPVSSGGSSSSSSSSSSTVPSEPPSTQPSGSTPATMDVSVDSAKTATSQALATGSTTVKFKNSANISLEALKAITQAAGNKAVTVWADSASSTGGVNVRLSFNPALRTAGMNMSAFTYSEQATAVKNLFEKWYQGSFAVISFGQKTDFSQLVRVSAKANLTGIDSSQLKFYSYDKATNVYRAFTPTYSVDSNGYLVFDTIMAGDIVITDRALVRR